MAPERFAKCCDIDCVFLACAHLCVPESKGILWSAGAQAGRYKVLCAQNARPYRPDSLIGPDIHLLCVREGFGIEIVVNPDFGSADTAPNEIRMSRSSVSVGSM
jgi:hypothetical protein